MLCHGTRLVVTLALIIALPFPAVAAEAQFLPLKDYVARPGSKTEGSPRYTAQRCSALEATYAFFLRTVQNRTI